MSEYMALPLGKYHECTRCHSKKGWILVHPVVHTLDELLYYLDNEDVENRFIFCTECSKGRVSGINPANEPKEDVKEE